MSTEPSVRPVVLITGARIGRATALAFARAGAQLIVSGRHEDEGKALAAELVALGAEAEFVLADVRHEHDVEALVDRTVQRFGRLDVAINNAGTEGTPGPAGHSVIMTRLDDTITAQSSGRATRRESHRPSSSGASIVLLET